MRMRVDGVFRVAAAAVVVLVLASEGATAQEPQEPLPARPVPTELVLLPAIGVVVTQEQMQQLEQWTRDFTAWLDWADQWLNRRQPTFWTNYATRNPKPDPPAWLADVCALLANDAEFARPCSLLAAWKADPLDTKQRRSAATTVAQHEAPEKTVWWQHLHLDGMWPTTQSNVTAIGLFGTHMTVKVAGRVQVFVAPGIMLISVPDLYGRRQLYPATDWGISYRLFNVGRRTVHFNLVHAWMFAGAANAAINPSLTLAGLSLTLKPTPR